MSTRKQKSPAKKSATPIFSARIDPELMNQLRAIAARERRSVAMQLTIVLEEYLARQKATSERR